MEILNTDIDGVAILKPKVFEDTRGYFFESFSQRVLEVALGRELHFVQDNESMSHRGVVRGLHFQRPPHAQAKLVRVIEGEVIDVAVDLRSGSPTFGKHVAVHLSAANKLQLFIPRGFAHGFSVISPVAKFIYKCDNYYAPESEGGISCIDDTLGIDWGLAPAEILLSPKDMCHPRLAELEPVFDMKGEAL